MQENTGTCIAKALKKLERPLTKAEKMKLARFTIGEQKDYLRGLGITVGETMFGKLSDVNVERKALLFFELYHQQGTWHCIPLIPGGHINDTYYSEQLLEDSFYFLGEGI